MGTATGTGTGRIVSRRVKGLDRTNSSGPHPRPVRATYGIRYAHLARGRRFDAPRAVAELAQTEVSGLRDVPVFWHRGSGAESVLGRGDRLNPQSDDAFFLNIWAPEGAAGLPVVVFFHGGGWNSGGGSVPWYDGRHLAAGGLVVVTVNYRVGAAGHLAESPAGSRERSLPVQDVLMALRWVGDRIAPFGGDPGRVTLAGQSAGGWLVHLMTVLPEASALFDRAAIWSMGTRMPRSPALHRHLASTAAQLSAPLALADLSSEALLEIGERTLTKALPPAPFAHAPTGWVPHAQAGVPAKLLDPVFAARACTASAVMFRTTADETGTYFHDVAELRGASESQVWRWIETLPASALPYDLVGTSGFGAASPYEKILAVSSWVQYQGPVRDLADAYAANGRPVGTRTFTHRSQVDGQLSGHCLDLPFQFATREEWADAPMLQGCTDDDFDALSHQLISDLVDFASGG